MTVLIVGAGPAGLTAAYTLFEAGFKDILLFEKSIFPRNKICAGGISPRTVKILSEIYGINFIHNMESEFFKINKVKVISSNGAKIIGHIPSKNAFPNYGFVVDRKSFDAMLLNEFQKLGGKIIFEKVVDINESNGTVATEKNNYKGDLIIMAAGFNSYLFHKINYDLIINTVVLRNETGEEDKENYPEIFFHKEIFPGYIWKFPEKKGFNIGCGVHCDKSKKEMERILRANGKIDTDVDFSNISHWPIGVNVTCKASKISKGKILYIGDSAGMTNPVTGEGIFYAIASGRLAAKAIIENDFDIFYSAVDLLFKKRKLSKIFSRSTMINIAVTLAKKFKFIEKYLIGEIANINEPLDIF